MLTYVLYPQVIDMCFYGVISLEATLRRLVYLAVKDLSQMADDVIIVTSR